MKSTTGSRWNIWTMPSVWQSLRLRNTTFRYSLRFFKYLKASPATKEVFQVEWKLFVSCWEPGHAARTTPFWLMERLKQNKVELGLKSDQNYHENEHFVSEQSLVEKIENEVYTRHCSKQISSFSTLVRGHREAKHEALHFTLWNCYLTQKFNKYTD